LTNSRGPQATPRSLDAASAAPSAASTADAAVAQLREAGLACDQAKGSGLHILGGFKAFVDGGIRGYETPFAIIAEPGGGYLAMVSGQGKRRDEEASVETLAVAVDAAISVYRRRRAPEQTQP
jgi:hypothetical protein